MCKPVCLTSIFLMYSSRIHDGLPGTKNENFLFSSCLRAFFLTCGRMKEVSYCTISEIWLENGADRFYKKEHKNLEPSQKRNIAAPDALNSTKKMAKHVLSQYVRKILECTPHRVCLITQNSSQATITPKGPSWQDQKLKDRTMTELWSPNWSVVLTLKQYTQNEHQIQSWSLELKCKPYLTTLSP